MRSCSFCDSKVQWLLTKFGDTRIPFDARPVPLADLPEGVTGWIPGHWKTKNRWGRETTAVLMAPLDHYGAKKRAAVEAVFTVHSCARYRAAVQAKQTVAI